MRCVHNFPSAAFKNLNVCEKIKSKTLECNKLQSKTVVYDENIDDRVNLDLDRRRGTLHGSPDEQAIPIDHVFWTLSTSGAEQTALLEESNSDGAQNIILPRGFIPASKVTLKGTVHKTASTPRLHFLVATGHDLLFRDRLNADSRLRVLHDINGSNPTHFEGLHIEYTYQGKPNSRLTPVYEQGSESLANHSFYVVCKVDLPNITDEIEISFVKDAAASTSFAIKNISLKRATWIHGYNSFSRKHSGRKHEGTRKIHDCDRRGRCLRRQSCIRVEACIARRMCDVFLF